MRKRNLLSSRAALALCLSMLPVVVLAQDMNTPTIDVGGSTGQSMNAQTGSNSSPTLLNPAISLDVRSLLTRADEVIE